jgi:hypothetical protein
MNSRGRDRAGREGEEARGKWGEGLLGKSMRSCYWGLGKLDAVPGFKSFLPHTPGRWLHPLRAGETQGPVCLSPDSHADVF